MTPRPGVANPLPALKSRNTGVFPDGWLKSTIPRSFRTRVEEYCGWYVQLAADMASALRSEGGIPPPVQSRRLFQPG